MSPASQRLGRIGVWSSELRYGDPTAGPKAATEIEALGFGALWIPDGLGGEIFPILDALLAATRHIAIATGIINVWKHEPSEVAAWWRKLPEAQQSRVMLGFGVSHAPMIGADYSRPLAKMSAYLDALDAEGLPRESRCLAALGPKMLDLSRERSAGAHPYLVTPQHTAEARERLGPGVLLAPEQGVILESDARAARAAARKALKVYLNFPNYVNNWRRLGFSEADVTEPSDALCDALFAWGGPDQIADRVEAHFAGGADHVCLQVVLAGDGDAEHEALLGVWRALAARLF